MRARIQWIQPSNPMVAKRGLDGELDPGNTGCNVNCGC